MSLEETELVTGAGGHEERLVRQQHKLKGGEMMTDAKVGGEEIREAEQGEKVRN